MPAPKGNQYWKKADPDKHGGQREYTATSLYKIALEYFDTEHENVWTKTQAIKLQVGKEQKIELIDVPEVANPFTLEGLCLYAGISTETWRRYRDSKDLCGVTSWAETVIRKNQLDGAMVGVYHQNIIARLLGLADNTNLNHSGSINFAEDDGVD